jgi:hypothetical protein
MVWWKKLLHPWWRPTGIVVGILGIAAATMSLVFGLSPASYLPFSIVMLVFFGFQAREMLRIQAAAENKDRYRPASTFEDDAAED